MFDFSPYGIASLCSDVPEYLREFLVSDLQHNWNEAQSFEIEIEVPLYEEPWSYFLTITVDPLDGVVTIERRTT